LLHEGIYIPSAYETWFITDDNLRRPWFYDRP
jgi:hypothetical protein